MKVFVHDLDRDIWRRLNLRLDVPDIVIDSDNGRDINEYMCECSQLVLISRCVYGGFSPFIQGVLEKYRACFGPLLELRHGQTHYEVRRKNIFGMICCFYGEDITPEEEEAARILSVSSGISLRARGVKILFCDKIEKLKLLKGECGV